jgi:hypothetical protein
VTTSTAVDPTPIDIGAPIAGPDTRPDLAEISTGVDFIALVFRAAQIEIGRLNAPMRVMK